MLILSHFGDLRNLLANHGRWFISVLHAWRQYLFIKSVKFQKSLEHKFGPEFKKRFRSRRFEKWELKKEVQTERLRFESQSDVVPHVAQNQLKTDRFRFWPHLETVVSIYMFHNGLLVNFRSIWLQLTYMPNKKFPKVFTFLIQW